jgi:hypothetical protein
LAPDLRPEVTTLLAYDTGPGTRIITGRTGLDAACPAGGPKATTGFWDIDGVPVLVDLFLNQDGTFAELDVWKASGEDIVELPRDRGKYATETQLLGPAPR